jgi:hypothetical protein
MGPHICNKENELGKMSAILDKISSEVYGNGQLGLAKTVPRLEEKISQLSDTIIHTNTAIAAQTTVIANLVSFQDSLLGADKYKKGKKLSAASWTAIISSTIIGIAAIIVTILLKI